MILAAPRKKANGETIIRPSRRAQGRGRAGALFVLLRQQNNRVRAVGSGFPTPVARHGDFVVCLSAAGAALVDRRGDCSRIGHNITS